MTKKILTILLMLVVSNCAHSTHSFRYGVGLNDGAEFPDTAVKTVGIVEQRPLWSVFDSQSDAGIFVDNRSGLGPTYYITPFSIGLQTHGPGLYAGYFVGPSLISQTDNRLSSVFEFENNLELGIRDPWGRSLSINLQHFSNAGLWLPNMGRDFFDLKITIPF